MGLHKYGNRKDANHKETVKVFRALGFVVFDVSDLPNCCDIMVSKNGHTIAVEIKDGSQIPSRRKLTTGEAKFAQDWCKSGNWRLVESVVDIEKINREVIKKGSGLL